GEQLALADAPVGGAAHHRLGPLALRPAEELGAVHQGLDDVRHAAAADQPDERQLELLRQPVAVRDGVEAHQSGSSPRSAAIPRSGRCTAAPTAAATVISKMPSSE